MYVVSGSRVVGKEKGGTELDKNSPAYHLGSIYVCTYVGLFKSLAHTEDVYIRDLCIKMFVSTALVVQ